MKPYFFIDVFLLIKIKFLFTISHDEKVLFAHREEIYAVQNSCIIFKGG